MVKVLVAKEETYTYCITDDNYKAVEIELTLAEFREIEAATKAYEAALTLLQTKVNNQEPKLTEETKKWIASI